MLKKLIWRQPWNINLVKTLFQLFGKFTKFFSKKLIQLTTSFWLSSILKIWGKKLLSKSKIFNVWEMKSLTLMFAKLISRDHSKK